MARTAFDVLMENPDWVQDPVTKAFRPRQPGEKQNPVVIEQMTAEAAKRGLAWTPPAEDAAVARKAPRDLSAGEYADYSAIAREVLRELGVLGRDPTDDEIVFFAKSGMNAESVLAHYSNVPEIIEKQPGIPYGLSQRGYEQRTRELAGAFASAFPGQRAEMPGSRATKMEREQSLFGGALKAGVSGQEFGQTLQRFQQERGRAPSLAEFEERRNRPQAVVGPRPGFAASKTAEESRSAGVSSARPAAASRRAK